MTITRLRKYPSEAELAQLYAEPHDHRRWKDHELRVAVTAQIGLWLGPYSSIADLSCGNASIARQIAHGQGPDHASLHLGDYAPGYHYTGPIEKTIHQIPDVGLFICSETIEHLANPQSVLGAIRGKAYRLLLSTPIGETAEVGNPEHVWGWGVGDVRLMLHAAGWNDIVLNRLELPGFTYDYQIWGCER